MTLATKISRASWHFFSRVSVIWGRGARCFCQNTWFTWWTQWIFCQNTWITWCVIDALHFPSKYLIHVMIASHLPQELKQHKISIKFDSSVSALLTSTHNNYVISMTLNWRLRTNTWFFGLSTQFDSLFNWRLRTIYVIFWWPNMYKNTCTSA